MYKTINQVRKAMMEASITYYKADDALQNKEKLEKHVRLLSTLKEIATKLPASMGKPELLQILSKAINGLGKVLQDLK